MEPATGLWSRTRGLLGRNQLEPGRGLWLKPCKQVHTFFMRFAIDVVFLDGNLTVLRVVREMRPWRVSPWVTGAGSVLELAAGAAREVGEGDVLGMSEIGPAMEKQGVDITGGLGRCSRHE